MNSLTIITLLACFFTGYFVGMYGRVKYRNDDRGGQDW